MKQCRHYLSDRKFLVRTDHGALSYLLNFKDLQGQMVRWLQVLIMYDFDIEHNLGRKHNNADALSPGSTEAVWRLRMLCMCGDKGSGQEGGATSIDRGWWWPEILVDTKEKDKRSLPGEGRRILEDAGCVATEFGGCCFGDVTWQCYGLMCGRTLACAQLKFC